MTQPVPLDIGERLDFLATNVPDKPAVIYGAGSNRSRTYTHNQLYKKTNSSAGQLEERKLPPGTRAAIDIEWNGEK